MRFVVQTPTNVVVSSSAVISSKFPISQLAKDAILRGNCEFLFVTFNFVPPGDTLDFPKVEPPKDQWNCTGASAFLDLCVARLTYVCTVENKRTK